MLLRCSHISRVSTNTILSESIILLGVTHAHLAAIRNHKCSRKDLFILKPLHHWSTLHYNELKRAILRILSMGPKNSLSLVEELARYRVESLEVHAVRMALVRYYKQGLLNREKRAGTFTYSISDRGQRRLQWLESLHE